MGFIKAVAPMKDHRLFLEMESGSSMTVNLTAKLNSMRYKALADESLFNKAKLDRDWDCVVWGNGLEFATSRELIDIMMFGEDACTPRENPKEKQLYRIYRVSGREFRIYLEYDEQEKTSLLTLPDFEIEPMYTGDGRPFTLSDRADCSHYSTKDPKEPSGECDDCHWFHREETPYDVIGVCMCDALRRDANYEL